MNILRKILSIAAISTCLTGVFFTSKAYADLDMSTVDGEKNGANLTSRLENAITEAIARGESSLRVYTSTPIELPDDISLSIVPPGKF